MAKYIRLNDKAKAAMVEQFAKWLDREKVSNEDFKLKMDVAVAAKPIIRFSSKAYIKLRFLLANFDKEVGFYGLVKHIEPEEYLIYDIKVYPQKVTGATVTTNEIELGKWYDTLTDEEFADKRMQGHSHVNMSPNPSSVDLEDRKSKIHDLNNDDYFIFFIFNKSLKFTVDLYQMDENIHYETDDIAVIYPDDLFWDEIEEVKTETAAPKKKDEYQVRSDEHYTGLSKEMTKDQSAFASLARHYYDDWSFEGWT